MEYMDPRSFAVQNINREMISPRTKLTCMLTKCEPSYYCIKMLLTCSDVEVACVERHIEERYDIGALTLHSTEQLLSRVLNII